jgi:serine protease Do
MKTGNQVAQELANAQDGITNSATDEVRAFLESLTGPSRGRITWLASRSLKVGIDQGRKLQIIPENDEQSDFPACARLSWSENTYEIEALDGCDIWVNGRRIGTAQLLQGDMVEFGETGPMSRFRLCQQRFPTRWPVEEILGDVFAYARSSRRPFRSRLSNAIFEGTRRILLETSIVFRITVIVVLIVLTTFVAMQYRSDLRIEQTMQAEALRVEAIAAALADARQEALTVQELSTLREQLDLQLNTNAERLAILERRLGASTRVISNSTSSVAFLQGAFGLRQADSGKLLRHVLRPDGALLLNPWGKPVTDVDGTGEPVEFQFTGTGFLLKDDGRIVTNRHVALPWTNGDRLSAFEQGGFAPEMLKLRAFIPGLQEPLEAELLGASDDADLALLSVARAATEGRGLTLSRDALQIGDEVIVMGFPTGLRALLAQAGRDFVKSLENVGETDFWTVALRLSDQDRIAPLASRGIIAQITPKAVIYDAETAVGGSGGPVLNINGEVVAVNAAILPEFGGANIGVPVAEMHRLLEATSGN